MNNSDYELYNRYRDMNTIKFRFSLLEGKIKDPAILRHIVRAEESVNASIHTIKEALFPVFIADTKKAASAFVDMYPHAADKVDVYRQLLSFDRYMAERTMLIADPKPELLVEVFLYALPYEVSVLYT